MSYPDTPEKLSAFAEDMFKQTEVVVEATDCERLFLWKDYSKDAIVKTEINRYTWEQMNPGICPKIGELAGFPVCVSCFWNKINGIMVCFWEATSRVVDYEMVKKWVLGRCRPTCQSTNAMNFHNAIIYIDEQNA